MRRKGGRRTFDGIDLGQVVGVGDSRSWLCASEDEGNGSFGIGPGEGKWLASSDGGVDQVSEDGLCGCEREGCGGNEDSLDLHFGGIKRDLWWKVLICVESLVSP